MFENLPLVILTAIAAIVIELAILCNKSLARTVPTNYILLGAFTFCEGYLVAFQVSLYDPSVVFSAAIMTLGTVSGLTSYAWTTKHDFTMMRGVLSIIITAFIMLILLLLVAICELSSLILTFFCVLIFGFYIVVDT